MAVGGVLYADLLSLPPPAKQVKAWVLRQVRPWLQDGPGLSLSAQWRT